MEYLDCQAVGDGPPDMHTHLAGWSQHFAARSSITSGANAQFTMAEEVQIQHDRMQCVIHSITNQPDDPIIAYHYKAIAHHRPFLQETPHTLLLELQAHIRLPKMQCKPLAQSLGPIC